MPIAYDPTAPGPVLFSRSVRRTLLDKTYLITVALFVVLRVSVSVSLTPERAKQFDANLTYPTTLIGTLFAFLIGFFTNNCFTRYMDNWRAAMVGWSRINDLGLQVYAYVRDRAQALEVMRLMHAANHLCYGDLAGEDMLGVCRRRHLLTAEEAARLREPGGPPPFYLAAAWALERAAAREAREDQVEGDDRGRTAAPVDPVFVLALDRSIVEWRQQTTLLPMIQMNPLPFPYYRNMVLLLVLFEVVVAFKIAIAGFEGHLPGAVDRLAGGALDTALFAAVSLVCMSIFRTSTALLMPWGGDDRHGATVDLPAEYFLLLPLVGHRRLFGGFADDAAKAAAFADDAAKAAATLFLRPLAPEDEKMAKLFTATDTWKMMRILKALFRDLAPPDGNFFTRQQVLRPSVYGSVNQTSASDADGAQTRLMPEA